MIRLHPRLFFSATLLALSFGILGCDEPNDPDLPSAPYRLVANLITNGTPLDVDVHGDLVAVADDRFGAVVMNMQRLDAIDTLFVYDMTNGASCTDVALDPVHMYLAAYAAGDAWGPLPVFDCRRETLSVAYQFQLTLGTPFGDLIAEPYHDDVTERDSIIFWATDLTSSDARLNGISWCREGETAPWVECPDPLPSYQAPRRQISGFSMRADHCFALALGEEGIQLYRVFPTDTLGSVNTPGTANDCAWYQHNIVAVADEYQLAIIDATDLNSPQFVASVTVSGADRLRKVIVDGPYACVLDEFDGIYVFDISEPYLPRYLQLLELYDPTSLSADNGRLYVTDRGRGLVIYAR